MARILEMLKFWRRRDPETNQKKKKKITLIPNDPPNRNHQKTTLNDNDKSNDDNYEKTSKIVNENDDLNTFTVPDLVDIRPFIDSSVGDRPISIRDLLSRISTSNTDQSSSNPQNKSFPFKVRLDPQPCSVGFDSTSRRGKRKFNDTLDGDPSFDQECRKEAPDDPNLNSTFDPSAIDVGDRLVCRTTHVSLQSDRSKRPRILPLDVTISFGSPLPLPLQAGHHPSNNNSSRLSRSDDRSQLIHGLPSEVWYRIFLFNGLSEISALIPNDRSQPGTRFASDQRVSRSKVSSALKAQSHRHDLIRLSKSLSQTARKAASDTLVLGTPKMVALVSQKLEADSKQSWNVQTLVVALPPPSKLSSLNTTGSTPSRNNPNSKSSTTPSSRSNQPSPRSARPKTRTDPTTTTPKKLRPDSVDLRRKALSPSRKRSIEKFQSVLIPPVTKSSTEVQTTRNTHLNSVSLTRTSKESEREELIGSNVEEDYDDEETICCTSLPSLFLSVSRSLKRCCLIGNEQVSTRALRSLSLLSNFLGSLAELYVIGGGESGDLFTLIQGLSCLNSRPKGASLKQLLITGRLCTIQNGSCKAITLNGSSSFGSTMNRSTSTSIISRSSSFSSNSSNSKTLELEHVLLGGGIPLSPEELNWLVSSSTSLSNPSLESLEVCLKANSSHDSEEVKGPSKPYGSIGKGNEYIQRKKIMTDSSRSFERTRSSLIKSFERVGRSLKRLSIDEDFNEPILSNDQIAKNKLRNEQNHRRVSFEDDRKRKALLNGGGFDNYDEEEEEEGFVLDEALRGCEVLELLKINCKGYKRLYSKGMFRWLPESLKELEIIDGIDGFGKDQGNGCEGIGGETEEEEEEEGRGRKSRGRSSSRSRSRSRKIEGGGGGLRPKDLALVRSQEYLIGLKKVAIKTVNNEDFYEDDYETEGLVETESEELRGRGSRGRGKDDDGSNDLSNPRESNREMKVKGLMKRRRRRKLGSSKWRLDSEGLEGLKRFGMEIEFE